MRAIVGVGTAAAFVSGSDYIRKTIGTPFAQGLFGACSVGAVGLALALVPLWGTWQAPFATAVIVALAGVLLVAQAPREPERPAPARVLPRVADRRLLPLAAMHSASFGFSVIIGNWVVTLLHRAGGDSEHVAGIAGGLTLFAGIVSRPLGGRLAGHLGVLRLSFLVGGGGGRGAGHRQAAAARDRGGRSSSGFAAGLPFAPCFAAAARLAARGSGSGDRDGEHVRRR